MRSSGVNCSKWEDDEAVVVSPLSTTCVLLLPPIRSPKCVDILDVEVVGLTSGGSVTWLQVIFYGIL